MTPCFHYMIANFKATIYTIYDYRTIEVSPQHGWVSIRFCPPGGFPYPSNKCWDWIYRVKLQITFLFKFNLISIHAIPDYMLRYIGWLWLWLALALLSNIARTICRLLKRNHPESLLLNKQSKLSTATTNSSTSSGSITAVKEWARTMNQALWDEDLSAAAPTTSIHRNTSGPNFSQ